MSSPAGSESFAPTEKNSSRATVPAPESATSLSAGVPSIRFDYPPSSFVMGSGRPLSESLSFNPSQETAAAADFYTFPDAVDQDKLAPKGGEKKKGTGVFAFLLRRLSRLWLIVLIVGAIVLAAIVVGVAVAVTNSNKSTGSNVATVTQTDDTGSPGLSSASSRTGPASSGSSSSLATGGSSGASNPSLQTSGQGSQQPTATGQPATAQPTGQPTEQATTQQPPSQPTTTTTPPPQPTTTSQPPAQNKFQIRQRGTSNCVAGSAYEACESSPGASSNQVFTNEQRLWKQASSGKCLYTFTHTSDPIVLDDCRVNDFYQTLTYGSDGTIHDGTGYCVTSNLRVSGSGCGTFDLLAVS
ncbi:hypothetical protein DFJ73DRAFT_958838 [Zopfochytrium polystomum]|nr:hypothetical protein DFJ73DRAFT_958838 [Zopfochytrium polystomum]